jgi:hypothetical protein
MEEKKKTTIRQFLGNFTLFKTIFISRPLHNPLWLHRYLSRRGSQSLRNRFFLFAMFYSQVLLSKKGPLAKIWLAAHFDRKLTKQVIASTDIKAVVEQRESS